MTIRGQASSHALDEAAVREALRAVDDPEVGMNIVDLGLVYRVEVGERDVHIDLTMTTAACPMTGMIVEQACDIVEALLPADAVVNVHLVWDPPWSPDRMSAAARRQLGWSS